MSENDDESDKNLPVYLGDPVVVRSEVQEGKNYAAYRGALRVDFWFSCAYCSATEIEAQGVQWEIDHYEPQAAGGTDEYSNLMYSCSQCNRHKSALYPPTKAMAAGHRYFKVDEEDPNEHIEAEGERLIAQTPTGSFNVEMLYLNSHRLRAIRKIRNQISKNKRVIADGLRALRRISPDDFDVEVRMKFLAAKSAIERDLSNLEIDEMIRHFSASEQVAKLGAEEKAERKAFLEQLKAVYPGKWTHEKTKAK